MTFPVVSIEQDLAHKWYARVSISDSESIFLKFHEYPSDSEIQEKAQEYVNKLAELQQVQLEEPPNDESN